jgi:hypothetical protein
VTTLLLILALFTKHFVIDFPLQGPYQWMNKGTYGHPGGLLHSALHGVGTFACFYFVAPHAAIYLALMDMFAHYHIDWAKMNINKRMGWAANTHPEFWYLMGLDQYLHALTYVGLVYLVT